VHIKSGIYSILNEKNQCIYIGSTLNFKHRKNQHFSALNLKKHNNKKLQNAWTKHGSMHFSFNIIEECNEKLLLEREQFWINFYQSYDNKTGYNLNKFADRKILDDNTKIKISKNHKKFWKNKKFSKEHREKMSKNSSKFWKDKKLSEQHKNKLSQSHKKPLIQLDRSGNIISEFTGIKEASEKTGFSEIGIQQVASGYKRKSIYGYSFKYKN
jgi:group I intron endonuclease